MGKRTSMQKPRVATRTWYQDILFVKPNDICQNRIYAVIFSFTPAYREKGFLSRSGLVCSVSLKVDNTTVFPVDVSLYALCALPLSPSRFMHFVIRHQMHRFRSNGPSALALHRECVSTLFEEKKKCNIGYDDREWDINIVEAITYDGQRQQQHKMVSLFDYRELLYMYPLWYHISSSKYKDCFWTPRDCCISASIFTLYKRITQFKVLCMGW